MHFPRKWAKVQSITEKTVHAYTQEHEHVVFRKDAAGIQGVRAGDIVSFEPHNFRAYEHKKPENKPPKWFGGWPQIIGRAVPEPEANTRPRPNAVVWKQEQETRADADGFRTVHALAGSSVAGAP